MIPSWSIFQQLAESLARFCELHMKLENVLRGNLIVR